MRNVTGRNDVTVFRPKFLTTCSSNGQSKGFLNLESEFESRQVVQFRSKGTQMRRLLSLVLFGAAMLVSGYAAVAQDKVEYNVSTCSPQRGATEFHAVVAQDKLTFTYALVDKLASKIEQDLSVPLKTEAYTSKNFPEGTIKIVSEDKDGGGLVGFIYQGRIAIAFTDSQGDLLMVAFGQVG